MGNELVNWSCASLFNRYFDYSEGNVGMVLQGWLSRVEGVNDHTLEMSVPLLLNLDVLDDLKLEWTAMLLQLLLYC